VGVKFNNTKQDMQVFSPVGLLQNAAQASCSAWVYLNALYSGNGVGCCIMDVGPSTDTSRFDLLVIPDGSIRLGARAPDSQGTQQILTSVTKLVVGQWYHIVGVIDYNANTGAIYINGVNNNATGTLSFPNRATDNTTAYSSSIGANEPNDEEWMNGIVDDARFYNRSLSADEVQTIYACRGNDSILYGLQSRWLMNEGYTGQPMGQFGPITISNIQSTSATTSGSSLTLAYTVPTGSNMILVVAATAEGSANNVIASNMTFAGTAMAAQASTRTTVATANGVAIRSLAVTSGQTGNIVVSWAANNSGRTMMVYVLQGVASATAEGTATNFNNTGVTTTGLTTSTDGAIVVTACANADGYVMTAVGTNHTVDRTLVAGAHAGALGHVTTVTAGTISGIGFTASPVPTGEALALAAFTPFNTLGSVRELSDYQYVATATKVPIYTDTFMKSRR